MKKILIVLLISILNTTVLAQEVQGSIRKDTHTLQTTTADLIPLKPILGIVILNSFDSPKVGVSAGALSFKSFVVESFGGYGSDRNGDIKTNELNYNTTQLRFGIAKNTELRVRSNISHTKYIYEPTGTFSENSGLAPLTVGAKVKIPTKNYKKWSNFAILVNFHLNEAASNIFKTAFLGHDVILAHDIRISEKSRLNSNVGLQWNGYDAAVSGTYTMAYTQKIHNRVGLICELFGTYPQEVGADVSFNGAFTYRITDELQGHVRSGFGISERAQDWFVGAGLAYVLLK